MGKESVLPAYEISEKRIYVAGHRGMVGSAICRQLQAEGCTPLTATRAHMDLRSQSAVEQWFTTNRPDAVVVAAATVGGIKAHSSRPAEFIYDNLIIAANVIEAAHRSGVEKLVFLGSSCIYPRLAKQPIREEELLAGPLEPSNEWYAIAKIAGIKLCQAYRRQYGDDYVAVMPTNLYGPGDNYDLESSHVLPAIIRKTVEAREYKSSELCLWGTGRPLREFLHVDDLANAVVFVLKYYSDERQLNIGSGVELSIADLAKKIASIADYRGQIVFDQSSLDGAPRKLVDSTVLRSLGWAPSIPLEKGIEAVLREYEKMRTCSTSTG